MRLPEPTKQEPLSDKIAAGVPNLPTARRSAVTAFSEVASLNSSAPVTQREASSRYVMRFSPLMRGSFMTCQSVCHTALDRGVRP